MGREFRRRHIQPRASGLADSLRQSGARGSVLRFALDFERSASRRDALAQSSSYGGGSYGEGEYGSADRYEGARPSFSVGRGVAGAGVISPEDREELERGLHEVLLQWLAQNGTRFIDLVNDSLEPINDLIQETLPAGSEDLLSMFLLSALDFGLDYLAEFERELSKGFQTGLQGMTFVGTGTGSGAALMSEDSIREQAAAAGAPKEALAEYDSYKKRADDFYALGITAGPDGEWLVWRQGRAFNTQEQGEIDWEATGHKDGGTTYYGPFGLGLPPGFGPPNGVPPNLFGKQPSFVGARPKAPGMAADLAHSIGRGMNSGVERGILGSEARRMIVGGTSALGSRGIQSNPSPRSSRWDDLRARFPGDRGMLRRFARHIQNEKQRFGGLNLRPAPSLTAHAVDWEADPRSDEAGDMTNFPNTASPSIEMQVGIDVYALGPATNWHWEPSDLKSVRARSYPDGEQRNFPAVRTADVELARAFSRVIQHPEFRELFEYLSSHSSVEVNLQYGKLAGRRGECDWDAAGHFDTFTITLDKAAIESTDPARAPPFVESALAHELGHEYADLFLFVGLTQNLVSQDKRKRDLGQKTAYDMQDAYSAGKEGWVPVNPRLPDPGVRQVFPHPDPE